MSPRERSRTVLQAAESVLAVSRAAIGLALSTVSASKPVLRLAPAPGLDKAAARLPLEHHRTANSSACRREPIE